MDVMNHQQAAREAHLMQANREELVERIARAMREDGIAQPLQGLYLYRRSSPLQLLHGVSEPSVAVIAPPPSSARSCLKPVTSLLQARLL